MPSSLHDALPIWTSFDEYLQQAKALQKQVDEAKAAQDAHFAMARARSATLLWCPAV